ncbi:MAG: acyltransferase family protein [Planctomycetaceae bacterium]
MRISDLRGQGPRSQALSENAAVERPASTDSPIAAQRAGASLEAELSRRAGIRQAELGNEVAARRTFEGRSTFIDALRGLAALSVACYHINRYGPLPETAAKVIPAGVRGFLDRGWIGVQVFFVISGFVIAYSVRNARVTPAYLGNYALRRSIRLDPPYWATIGFVLLVHWVFALHLGFVSPMDVPDPMETPVTWKLLAAHGLYLQNILGYENLSAGFWTLCIEVQFYLLYVVGLGVAQRLSAPARNPAGNTRPWALLGLFAPLAIASLFVWNLTDAAVPWYHPGRDHWITHFLCMFFLGFAGWWALDGRVPAWAFWTYAALLAMRLCWYWSLDLSIALVAAVSIYLLGRAGRLTTALDYRWLQYLGRISYSLYLVHFPVAHVVTTLGHEHMTLNKTLTPLAASSWLLAALAASVVAAHLMYTFVEAPSVRLGARLKRAPQRA